MPDYEMVLPFDREGEADAPFAHGFECGRIWELLKADDGEFSHTVHAENAEMMIRMGESLGRVVRAVELTDEWLEVTFEAAA